jgi:hypothetical protein
MKKQVKDGTKHIMLEQPISQKLAKEYKDLVKEKIGEDFVNVDFFVKYEELNRVVQDADSEKFKWLNFYFIHDNEKKNKLNIALVFTNEMIGHTKFIAFWLDKSGNLKRIDSNTILQNLRDDFKRGIGREMGKNLKLTEYISYSMDSVKEFKGFEHNLNFKLIVKKINESSEIYRNALMVWIKDSDRKHEYNNSNQGFYNVGNLHP